MVVWRRCRKSKSYDDLHHSDKAFYLCLDSSGHLSSRRTKGDGTENQKRVQKSKVFFPEYHIKPSE